MTTCGPLNPKPHYRMETFGCGLRGWLATRLFALAMWLVRHERWRIYS